MSEVKHKHKILISITILVMYIACLAAGFALMSLLFRHAGAPSTIMGYLISAVAGTFLFIIIASIISFFWNGHQHYRMQILDETVEALGRMAKGDFNVSVKIEEHEPLAEVAESVNKMAHELASLETQRQNFISNVSHEIQSPLTSISGFAALLRGGKLTEEQRDHYLDIIETESKRLSKLSDHLLKLSNLEAETHPLTKQEFRLDKQISNAVLMLEPQWAAKKITVDAELSKVVVYGDEELLSQVWINLLHNSIKFTPEGGRIYLSLQRHDAIAFIIADNGMGIPAQDQIHIFERFYKVDKSRDRSLGGNGLGLSLCKKIIELHDGKITLESQEGQGTTFIIELPD